MADTDTQTPDVDQQPEKKGVGVVGGILTAGGAAATGLGVAARLRKTAVTWNKADKAKYEAAGETAGKKAEEAYKTANPTTHAAGTTEFETWEKAAKEAGEKAAKEAAEKAAPKAEKLGKALTALEEVEKSNFAKKGTRVIFKGGNAKVAGIALASAVAAGLVIKTIVKSVRNSGNHADQETARRENAAQSAGQSV